MEFMELISQEEEDVIFSLENLLSKNFNISGINRNGLIVCMTNSARANEIGLPNITKYALLGDKLLDFLIYEAELDKDVLLDKGKLDFIRQQRTNKTTLHRIMVQSKIANHILTGGSQPLKHYLKYSIHPVSDQFEALIYILYFNVGLVSVRRFLKELDFL